MMLPDFQSLLDLLEPKLAQLVASDPVTYRQLPRGMPKRGVYLFSEGPDHLYVGRSNGLRSRLRGHCSAASTHHSAAFAFRIARQETGNVKASYRTEGSRQALMNDESF